MVGHSRGGLLNLLYSMEHPNVVDTLMSVGTPYNGSNLGEIPGAIGLLDLFSSVINDVPLTYDEIEKKLNSSNYSECIKDILNENLLNYIKYKWNMRQSTTTKLITIGTSISFSFLKNMLSSIDFGTGSSESFKEYVFNWIITDVFEKFYDLIDSSYLNIDEKEEFIDKYNVKVTSYRTYQYINREDLFFAGQITGVEGYVESSASGLIAGINMAQLLNNKPLFNSIAIARYIISEFV